MPVAPWKSSCIRARPSSGDTSTGASGSPPTSSIRIQPGPASTSVGRPRGIKRDRLSEQERLSRDPLGRAGLRDETVAAHDAGRAEPREVLRRRTQPHQHLGRQLGHRHQGTRRAGCAPRAVSARGTERSVRGCRSCPARAPGRDPAACRIAEHVVPDADRVEPRRPVRERRSDQRRHRALQERRHRDDLGCRGRLTREPVRIERRHGRHVEDRHVQPVHRGERSIEHRPDGDHRGVGAAPDHVESSELDRTALRVRGRCSSAGTSGDRRHTWRGTGGPTHPAFPARAPPSPGPSTSPARRRANDA